MAPVAVALERESAVQPSAAVAQAKVPEPVRALVQAVV
jgi:hypothetical protein